MHPEIKQDRPGMCPECGMTLIMEKPPKHEHQEGRHEHDKHAGHSTEQFLRQFWFSLALTLVVLLYSELPEKLFGYIAPAFPGSHYIGIVLGSLVFFTGGLTFLKSAFRELRARLPGMMTLIALAISAAYFYSVYAVISGQEHTLFWELTTLITIMLLGHWVEMKAVQGAQGALKELSKLLPDTAEVIRGDEKVQVPIAELKMGDLVFVRPGGRIPVDGTVTSGASDVNESLVTGESAPVHKIEGSAVIAGTANGDGTLTIKVAQIGEHTFLAGIMRLVKDAQASKSRLQLLSDRVAYYLTLVAIGAGGITLAAWIIAGAGFDTAVERMVAVLVITCPHALGLAIPLVASISTTLAARNGFLVRQRSALELARSVSIVLFDKTGTLTKGEYGVVALHPEKGVTEEELLGAAASVDSHSEHVVSKAIVEEAKKKGITLKSIEQFVRLPGIGGQATVDGATVAVGGEGLLGHLGISAEHDHGEQGTHIFVTRDGGLLGYLVLADVIREESRTAIHDLQRHGIKVAMVTGDSEAVAKSVSDELGIDKYYARILPGGKREIVELLQKEGERVAMVGDGINDAPALTQADIGIAIGAGTNVAIESAGIILVRNDPRDIPRIISLSRKTYSKMIQNLLWATGYNVVALPLAAGVLASRGIVLEPAVSALLMSMSTIIVAFNAVLLRNTNLNA